MPPVLRAAGSYAARRAALRILPWTWPLWVAKGTYDAFENELTARQRGRLQSLLLKGFPCPTALSQRERTELRNLLRRVPPQRWAHYVVAEVSPLPWPQAPAN
jgi:hypothetical protein